MAYFLLFDCTLLFLTFRHYSTHLVPLISKNFGDKYVIKWFLKYILLLNNHLLQNLINIRNIYKISYKIIYEI